MSVFSPSPSYRVASRGELMGAAMDLPFSPLKNLGEQFRGGVLDSFGLGTVLKDFQIPRSTDTSNQPPVPAFNPIDLAYEGIHSLFGAKPGGKTLSQDDWKASPYYREELPWDAGMTEDRAAALALFYDQRVARQFFGQKDMVTTLLGGFAGGGVDPVNFIPVFGPVARAAATARAGFIIGHALIGASEAAINTAAFGYLTAPQRAALGDDVSLETSINNIVFSAGAGLLFGGVGGAFARRAARVSARAAAAEREIAEATQTIRNLRDTRDVLNDATVSLATRGEVDLQPKSGAILDRIATDVADRRDAARALEVETRGITGDKSGEVVISASGARVRVQPEVVELATLQKATGALQVRDRSRQASDAWIEETATRLDPALLMPAINADKGAPLVGSDNIIDSGNGRTSAIARAYAAYPDRAAAYRKAIEDAGYSTEGMTQPVLVNRRLTELSPDARAQFNADSQGDTARMSATELASMDRAALDESALALLKEGPITSAANRGFVDRFLANLPASERGSLVDERGIGLNADGQRRIENALVAAAYGDVDAMAVRKFAEATDDNTRSIVGAMSDVAGAWVRMRRAAKSGEISAELDQTPELTEALRRLSGWREQAAREGRKVGMVIKEGMGQLDVFTGEIPAPVKAFIRAFYNDADFTAAAGRDKIAGRLFDLVDTSLETGVPDLLGEARAATKMGVLKDAFLNDLEADLLEIDGMAARAGTLGEAGAGRMAGAGGQGDQGRIGQGGSGRPGAIRQLMSDRFAAGGRPRDEAEAAGAMVEAFYHGLAQRAGTTVDDLVARFGLPEVRAADVAPEGALAQNVPGNPAFDRWFGDSKVVDENGEPLVVYHGSPAGVPEAFDPAKIGTATDSGDLGRGFYFTRNFDHASVYTAGADGAQYSSRVTRAYLSLKNPLREFTPDFLGAVERRVAAEKMPTDQQDWSSVGPSPEGFAAQARAKAITDEARARGYDGVWMDNPRFGYEEIVAFDPTQIKSVNNRGTFDPNDPRILFQPSADNGGNGLAGDGVGGAGSPSGMPSSGDKSLSDVARVRAQELRDLLVADSGVVKPFGDLDVVGQTRVLAMMRDLAQDLKIAESVVPLVPVDVVNVLGSGELTAKALLDKPAMLIDLLPANPDNLVARDIAAMNELSAAMTRAATEAAGLPLPGAVGEGRAAGGANVGFHQNTIPDPNKAGNARGSIQFGDTGSIITLLKNADASTALHESSHHFLMMFKSMAEQADAPLEIARDWSVVKDWWGANADRVAADSPADGVTGADVRAVLDTGTTGDRIKDLAINVGLQEQWARGFERYAADGVAPTEGLRAVFAQFKDWLRRVYRALTDLRVDVSPEVKGVFDRLLGGSEEQAAFDLGQPAPRQPIDMTKPAPEPRPDGIEAAAARVGKTDEIKALAEQFGVKDDGTFAEEAEIEQMRATGRLTPEDEAALAFADQTAKDADAYAETLRAAAACVMG